MKQKIPHTYFLSKSIRLIVNPCHFRAIQLVTNEENSSKVNSLGFQLLAKHNSGNSFEKFLYSSTMKLALGITILVFFVNQFLTALIACSILLL